MFNVRLVLVGIALTLLSAYVVVNMDREAEATCYFMSITYPEDGSVFYEGATVEVHSSWELPGNYMDPIDITAELQCTMTSRLEDSDVDHTVIPANSSTHWLIGPTDEDSDVSDDFCIVVSGGGQTDRIGATFVPSPY